MSSKVLQPDDPLPVSPVAWRLVTAAPSETGPGAADAQRELQGRVAQLERQCEQRVQEARAAGVREGEAAGRSRAAAELQPVLQKLARAIDEISQLRPRLRREAEADMVRLAMAIARRVLRRELAVDPSALHGLVLGALEKLQGQEISRVKVHPSQAAAIAAAFPPSPSGSPCEIVSDPSCQVGDVIFETSRGNLDASVDSQLQEIERGLTDRLRRNS